MLSIKNLRGDTIHATDGDFGSVDDFLFDDENWAIRYLVVDTGKWIPGRRVLISPAALKTQRGPDELTTSLSKEQIKNSPDIYTDEPVSRQREAEYLNYYGYPYYWRGPSLWGTTTYPFYPEVTRSMEYPDRVSGSGGSAAAPKMERLAEAQDTHLRSAAEVIGYHIEATDGEIGHVEDFIVDDDSWIIRYMVVDTVNWWPGKKVVVAPEWITGVSWPNSRVSVDLSRARIKNAPEYDPRTMVSRDYEDRLYEHYSRPKYWEPRL
ncbi:MAG TPA: PRC-barrel domain-containing protein [Pyrinomonadaceae bacterium]|nr:PRC-barrel domain-containing protein [Pyrinomonadaceae bacterium]